LLPYFKAQPPIDGEEKKLNILTEEEIEERKAKALARE
jgi:hypothetical protein